MIIRNSLRQIDKFDLGHKRRIRLYVILLFVLMFGVIWIGYKFLHNPPRIAHKQKILLIGIDAADWDLIDELIRNNHLPNLKRIKETGASGKISSIPTKRYEPIWRTNYLSSSIWTSIVTSRSPEEHGIDDFYINRQIAGPAHRKAPAIWNILTYYNKRSAIIGWFCTWPSEEINGFMVSSNVGLRGYNLKSTKIINEYGWASRWRQQLTYPPELIIALNRMFIRKSVNPTDFVSQNILDMQLMPLSEKDKKVFSSIIWQDLIYMDILKFFINRKDLDFIAVYFEGIDTIQHHFWKFTLPSFKELIRSGQISQKYGNVITNYYDIIDKMIGEIVAMAKDNYTIIIVSDHGGKTYPYNSQYFSHSETGVFYASGPIIRKKKLIHSSTHSLFDILPTILYIMDVPLTKEFHGTVMQDILIKDFLASRKAIFINTYPISLKQKTRKNTDLDEEYKEKLKSLGYL